MDDTNPQGPQGRTLQHWTDWLAGAEIPVLRPSARALQSAAERADSVSPRELAGIVLLDPLLTARLYVHVAQFREGRAAADITAVERMIVLLGVPPFLAAMGDPPVVEQRLAGEPAALRGLLAVIRRAMHAAEIGMSLAAWRNDLGYEEIREAAMLHDLAEMLAWCFAPQPMAEIARRQAGTPGLRSATLQDAVLGFRLLDLQLALAERWHLPRLLISMMDDAHAVQPRERSVTCAVNIARHASHGWDDAALPDDWRDAAELLNTSPEKVEAMVRDLD
jgi:HD-like signal output (HDOD) protein